jgi:hypothetical protein
MAFPTFTKLGTKLTTPAWMTSTGNRIIYPRVFDNDANRGVLAGLPAAAYSCLYSSDHSSGTGYIGRADFETIEGTWTDSGAAIHSGSNQRETPHPVFDSVNSRVNVYVHDSTSTGTHGVQATRLLTSTTLGSLTDQGEAATFGHHTGYAEVEKRAGTWEMRSLLVGGDAWLFGLSTSGDGATFALSRVWHPGQQHITGTGNGFNNSPVIVQYDGDWYWITSLVTRPMGSATPSAIVAVPIVSPTDPRPTGGYYTLLTPGSSGADDEVFSTYLGVTTIDNTLYLLYSAYDSGGDASILLAKENGGSATQVTPEWPINADGTLERDTAETEDIIWDATADTLPGAMTVEVGSGTNSSAHSPGNYYELKTGSGSAQDLRLKTTATFNPLAIETLDVTWQGVTFYNAASSNTQAPIQLGLLDSFSNTNGVSIFWAGSVTARAAGQLTLYAGGVLLATVQTNILPYSSTESSGAVSRWCRGQAMDLTLRVHDFGKRLSVLVDGHVAYHRDIEADGVTWAAEVFGFLRLTTGSPHPQHYARVQGVEVRTFTGQAPDPVVTKSAWLSL